ncbi:MAG: carotenoid oxygenase family protein [Gloeotrichia echinulata DVL01]|jgi:carotenoid cleavage dioxygenase-like enzyme|nr:carotenoid oxygenase family protein [Gloeotrichia echinulata DEX184]
MLFKVTGRVYEAESGAGLNNLVVEAFDKDILKNDKLGQTQTDNDGNFEITYTEANFKNALEIFEGNPDLYIIVKNPEISEIFYSSEKNIRNDASNNEHFDIAIPKATLLAYQQKSLQKNKELFKILVGMAWLDGVLEPGEKEYLAKVATQKGLAEDAEIQGLLSDSKPVQPQECFDWLQAYLGENPSPQKFATLDEVLESLVTSDGVIDEREKELLAAFADKNTRQTALQKRLASIFLDPNFLAKVTPDTPDSPEIAGKNLKKGFAYARVPQAIFSKITASQSDPKVKEELAHRFLTSNFAPVHQEITADNLEVIGKLPQELSGMFFRIGPNPHFFPLDLYHWFDGDGMIHGVHILDGTASYRNRYVRTEGFKIEEKEGQAIWPGLLNLPRFDQPHGFMMKNVANTALVWHHGRLLALWEGGEPYELSVPDLETVGPYTFNGQLTFPFTAHPKVDAKTGEMIFFGYQPLTKPYVQYGIVSPEGKIVKTIPIDIPSPISMHDFAITEKYTIFMDMPLALKPMRIMQGKIPLVFERNKPSRFGIIPRHGGEMRWFTVPNCMVYHVVNAYEEGNEVILVAYRMDWTQLFIPDKENPVDFDSTNSSATKLEPELTKLYRWRFNLSTGQVQEEMLDDEVCEFPRINDNLIGRKMRYVYAGIGAMYMERPLFDGVKKYDLEAGTAQSYHFGRGRFGGECVFAPRPGSKAEDEGWVLTYIHDSITKRSELIILDAQNITAEPVARLIIPQRVPFGFHCEWVRNCNLITTHM